MLQLTLNYTAPTDGEGRRVQTAFVRKSFVDIGAILDHLVNDKTALAEHLVMDIQRGQRAGVIEENGATLVWMIRPTRGQRHRN